MISDAAMGDTVGIVALKLVLDGAETELLGGGGSGIPRSADVREGVKCSGWSPNGRG